MAKNFDLPVINEDPQNILGIAQDAKTEEIRAAYLNKIKEYPPDKSPAEFERVRDAYTILSDPRNRTRMMLQSADPEAPLVALLDNQKQNRQIVGPKAWLDAMQKG
jgi:preprotein translocase subunit Sec63